MRRIATRLALTAGAGVVLLTAGSALASTTPEDWADRFSELSGYSGVSCLVSTIPGGQSSVYISEDQWSSLLQGDNEFVGIALQLEDGTAEHSPFLGYGADHIYSSSTGTGIERAVVCQGAPTGEEVAAPVEGETTEDAGADEDTGSDDTGTDGTGTDDDSGADEPTDEPTEDTAEADDEDGASGPPVETDGPSSAGGVDPVVLGGAALAVAGVGIAGYALRRRHR